MVAPNVWGPHAWKFIHYVTLSYPIFPNQENKDNYKQFFLTLQYILPCHKCRKHYKENLNKFPLNDLVLSNNENLVKWGIDLHNYINKLHNKPELSYNDAYKLFNNDFKIETFTSDNIENIYNKKNNDCNSNYIISFLVMLCIILFIIIIYKK